MGASEPLMLWVVVAIASQERERFRSPFGLPCTSEIPRVYCFCRVLFYNIFYIISIFLISNF